MHDYGLQGAYISACPAENQPSVHIDQADFAVWLWLAGYILDYSDDSELATLEVALNATLDGFPIWEPFANWLAEPTVIHNPLRPVPSTGLLDYLLEQYLANPANPRFNDVRGIDDLPEQFLTAAEKAAKTIDNV